MAFFHWNLESVSAHIWVYISCGLRLNDSHWLPISLYDSHWYFLYAKKQKKHTHKKTQLTDIDLLCCMTRTIIQCVLGFLGSVTCRLLTPLNTKYNFSAAVSPVIKLFNKDEYIFSGSLVLSWFQLIPSWSIWRNLALTWRFQFSVNSKASFTSYYNCAVHETSSKEMKWQLRE